MHHITAQNKLHTHGSRLSGVPEHQSTAITRGAGCCMRCAGTLLLCFALPCLACCSPPTYRKPPAGGPRGGFGSRQVSSLRLQSLTHQFNQACKIIAALPVLFYSCLLAAPLNPVTSRPSQRCVSCQNCAAGARSLTLTAIYIVPDQSGPPGKRLTVCIKKLKIQARSRTSCCRKS